jgi:3-oxoacyl-[acyl-carrier-protein] synthase III
MPPDLAAVAPLEEARPTASRPGILAAGMALPRLRVTSAEVAERLGVEERWIVSRTGVAERRRAEAETVTDLATAAARDALDGAGVAPAEVDLLLVATMTPDRATPDTAPLVAHRLGVGACATADVRAACSGFLTALTLASAHLQCGGARVAVVVGCEAMSRIIDRDDRATAALFGDGAGAVVLRGRPGTALLRGAVLDSDGSGGPLIATNDDGLVRMQGPETFKRAVTELAAATRSTCRRAGVELDDVDVFAFHQANGRILEALSERLQLPADRVLNYIERFGNTSSASIPIALAAASRAGRLHAGQLVLLACFGAGLTWGAGIVQWGETS